MIYTEVSTSTILNEKNERGTMVHMRVYDERAGFNQVMCSERQSMQKTESGPGFELGRESLTGYRQILGTFVADDVKWHTFNNSPMSSGAEQTYQLKQIEHFSLVFTEINKPLAANEFDISQFNLKYGERMLDEINSTLSVYDDKLGFVPADKFVFDPARVK